MGFMLCAKALVAGQGWRGQEPGGMTQLADRAYNADPEDGWHLAAASGSVANFSIITDGTAPHSPSNVGQIKFPLNFAGGGEPCNSWKGLGGLKNLYLCMAYKISNPFEGHGSSINKVFHLVVNGSNRVVLAVRGASTAALQPTFYFQGIGGTFDAAAQGGEGVGTTGLWCMPNQVGQTGVTITRGGPWVQWEAMIDAGTAGNADGTLNWWMDGVKVGSYINIPFIAVAGAATWDELDWAPTWGGGGGTVPADQYMWIDHLYVSGKN